MFRSRLALDAFSRQMAVESEERLKTMSGDYNGHIDSLTEEEPSVRTESPSVMRGSPRVVVVVVPFLTNARQW